MKMLSTLTFKFWLR